MQKTTAGVRVDLDATKLMLCLLLIRFLSFERFSKQACFNNALIVRVA
jgi:hypothetical protein